MAAPNVNVAAPHVTVDVLQRDITFKRNEGKIVAASVAKTTAAADEGSDD